MITSASNKDGFTHKPESFEFKVFNGSKCNTITSNYDGERGKRSNCNIYDECGFLIEKAFATTEPYTAQNKNFKLGGNVQVTLEPKEFPNQLIYLSSAGAVDTHFWKKYRDFGKKAMMGNKDYFVADLPCEISLNPTFNGKKYSPLLSQLTIDNAMREDRDRALREYYNKFEKDGGDEQPFKRGKIIANSYARLPLLENDTNTKRRIVMAYDPARSYDNSIVMVGELIYDNKVGWTMHIVNCIKLVDLATKKKIPMQQPDQIKYIKELLLKYNGDGFGEYENIDCLLIDSGAGGGGVNIADYFMPDWIDETGTLHRGLIDREESKEYIPKYPKAYNKIKLMSPKKWRTEMFDSLAKMMDMDLIKFPEEYDGKPTIQVPEETSVEVIDEKTNEKTDEIRIKYKTVRLDFEEKIALSNINLTKIELINIMKTENADKTQRKYALSKEKQNTMHDDRAYCMAMMGWYLAQTRRENITKKAVRSKNDPNRIGRFKQPRVRF